MVQQLSAIIGCSFRKTLRPGCRVSVLSRVSLHDLPHLWVLGKISEILGAVR